MAHPQLLATAVVFLCGNLMGAFHKHHMQDASHDLFTYTVKCIQIRRKLRIEKRQQVGLPPLVPLPSPRPHALCPFSDNVLGMYAGHLTGHLCRRPLGVAGPWEVCARGLVQDVHQLLGGTAQRGWRPDAALPMPMCQENLLLSVLPAHISMGMKLAIIERLKERGDRRYLPDNNFHNLYVKRHQNVRSVSWGGKGLPSYLEAQETPPDWGEVNPGLSPGLSLPTCSPR